ncbi:hypothetical protein [Sinorhizobium americanum]|uniref:Uncharacterized protein n=1 Tax=Sinorhizobium americanum TaxID=194963 RepID=A0A1L3LSD9_9HYPH|nr:hypothetical protein [Sinorhizobium americanum]APG93001.1 hypothetical protein SAMCFNEI73_pA0024 [Sinorhizobium americanum]OAP50266.1 hypothetical protein ATC00_14740 [Sinorhizobium americanum]
MRNLKLNIEGSWWDSLLYKGHLHLFGTDGSISVFAWETLVSELAQSIAGAEKALRFAFSESNAVYRSTMNVEDVRRCFDELPATEFDISSKELAKYRVSQADSGFPFPHATSSFHYDRMIVATSRGIFGSHYNTNTQDRSEVVRLSPVGANQAWPAYGNVAVAAGNAGLYQIDIRVQDREWPKEQEGDHLSARTCEACDWMFGNIIGMSFEEGSVLARFRTRSLNDRTSPDGADAFQSDDREADINWQRSFSSVDRLEEVVRSKFDPSDRKPLTWGSQDKLYKVEGKNLVVYRLLYNGKLQFIGKLDLPANLTNLVSVKTSLFGLVFEFDDSLLVLTSDGQAHALDGEPVNWRVFPRSRRYENHLHVLGETSLAIYSFNQDVEQDQFKKLIGTRAPANWSE